MMLDLFLVASIAIIIAAFLIHHLISLKIFVTVLLIVYCYFLTLYSHSLTPIFMNPSF